jgi:PAS domain S-box-containing protein
MNEKNIAGTVLNVLSIEDSVRDFEIIREQLIDAGYHLNISRVETEKELESSIRGNQYDIILADFKLPGFDAFGALRLCNAICPEVPFICVSGTIGEETAIELIKLGAVDYVLKDRMARLPSAVKRALDELKEKERGKRAEEELRKSEENFRLSLDDSPLGVRILTAEGETLYANQATLKIYGYDRIEELKRTPVKERYTPESYAEFKKRKEKRERGEVGPSEYEINVVRKNGEVRHIQVFRKEIWWNSARQFQVIYIDITERRKTEEELLIIKKAVESSSDAIGISDPQGHHFYQNKAFSALFEYTSEELDAAGGGPAAFADKKVAREMFDAIMGGLSWSGEVEMVSKSGRKFLVLVRADAIKEESGKITGLIGLHTDITERKHAEEVLRESKERFRIAAENASDLIWEWDIVNGKLEWFGDIDAILGYAPGEFPRTIDAWERVIHLDDHDRVMAAVDQHLKTQSPYREEYRVCRKDGTLRYWTDKGVAVCNSQSHPYKMIGVCTDITDRKRAEEALLQSNKQYRLLADNVNDVISVLDMNLKYIYISPSVKILRGYEPEEVLKQQSIEQTLTPSSRDLAMKTFFEIMELEKSGRREEIPMSQTLQLEMKRKDGTTVWTEVKFSFIRDENQRSKSILSLTRDITERRHAEHELRDSEVRLNLALETNDTGVWELNLLDHTAFRTLIHDRIFGYETLLPNWTYEMFLEHVLPEDRPEVDRLFREAIAAHSDWNFECRIRRTDGEVRWILATGRHNQTSKGAPVQMIGIVQDITERKMTEEALRESEGFLKFS